MAAMAAPMLAAVNICALAHSLSSRRFFLHLAQVHGFVLRLHTLDMCATGNFLPHVPGVLPSAASTCTPVRMLNTTYACQHSVCRAGLVA
jgi:hypothetical protein